MESKYYATIKDGKIVEWTDSSSVVELAENQIPLTLNEWKIVNALRADLDYGKLLIRDIEERVKAKEADNAK